MPGGELHASRKNGGSLRSLEFASHPAARAPGHPDRMRGNLWRFSAIGVWSLGPGRPAAGSSAPVTKCHIDGSFGVWSFNARLVRQIVAGRGSLAFLCITRVLGPRSYGPGPWFCSHETI